MFQGCAIFNQCVLSKTETFPFGQGIKKNSLLGRISERELPETYNPMIRPPALLALIPTLLGTQLMHVSPSSAAVLGGDAGTCGTDDDCSPSFT